MKNWREKLYENKDGRWLITKGIHAYFPLYQQSISLTYKCTRRCSDCYVYHQIGDDNKMRMSDEVFEQLCNVVDNSYDRHNVLHQMVNFIGGEPLLETKRIGILSDIIFEKTPGMEIIVYTNGDLVDMINYEDLKRVTFYVLNTTNIPISEIERRLKVLKNKSLNENVSLHIASVLNNFNLDRIEDIVHFSIKNRYKMRFTRNSLEGDDPLYINNLIKGLHKACNILEDYKNKGTQIDTFLMLDNNSFGTTINGRPWSSHTCGARTEVIFPDGSIGVCTRAIGHPDSIAGYIWDDDINDKLDSKRKIWKMHHKKYEECRDCEIGHDCNGGCTYDRWLTNKKLDGIHPFCKVYKEILPRLKKLHYYQNFEMNPCSW